MVRSVVRMVGAIVAVAALVALASETRLGAQTKEQALGSVTVSKKVMANGQPLAPGTYTLRLLPEEPE